MEEKTPAKNIVRRFPAYHESGELQIPLASPISKSTRRFLPHRTDCPVNHQHRWRMEVSPPLRRDLFSAGRSPTVKEGEGNGSVTAALKQCRFFEMEEMQTPKKQKEEAQPESVAMASSMKSKGRRLPSKMRSPLTPRLCRLKSPYSGLKRPAPPNFGTPKRHSTAKKSTPRRTPKSESKRVFRLPSRDLEDRCREKGVQPNGRRSEMLELHFNDKASQKTASEKTGDRQSEKSVEESIEIVQQPKKVAKVKGGDLKTPEPARRIMTRSYTAKHPELATPVLLTLQSKPMKLPKSTIVTRSVAKRQRAQSKSH